MAHEHEPHAHMHDMDAMTSTPMPPHDHHVHNMDGHDHMTGHGDHGMLMATGDNSSHSMMDHMMKVSFWQS